MFFIVQILTSPLALVAIIANMVCSQINYRPGVDLSADFFYWWTGGK